MKQRPSTREEYLKQINIVTEYIKNHLDDNIDLKTLAEMSNFSPFHFQRIMKAFLEESIGIYIVRMRVETAARLIRYSEMSIQDIAYHVGYDMPSSLSKVFKQFYGISPTEYRTNKEFAIMKPLQVNTELNIKKPKLLEIETRQIIYIQHLGDYGQVDYGGAWQKLWGYVKENKVYSAGIEHICISYDDPKITEASKLRTDICLVLPKKATPKAEVGVREMPGGKFLMFLYQGSYSNLGSVYDTVYTKYLPESGYTLRDALSFEKYISNPERTDESKLKTEIYIPVQ